MDRKDGEALRALREQRGWSQLELAQWLNAALDRKYDKAQCSRWERSAEAVPVKVAELVAHELLESQPRNAVIIACGNQKGGVAKTETATCLAYLLRERGARVLLVDCDSQGNASIHVGLTARRIDELEETRRTLYYAMVDDKTAFTDFILPTDEPRVDLVPAFMSLAEADFELASAKGLVTIKERLAEIRDQYDYVILDTAPNLGLVTIGAFEAADLLLVPVQTEAFALLGLKRLMQTVERLQHRKNRNLRVLGLLPTLFSARNSQDQASLEELQRNYGSRFPIFPPVPRATVYGQAAAAGVFTLSVGGKIPGRDAFEDVANAVRHAKETLHATA
ncbi:AAA family ATPase [Azospirillum sp. RWY-5-1]|uniref:AAA family ATPase n=1 Tax=Azospirillum oleiclasticum TaxID=2735135 RepID=A0ABX2TA10_9PROT|nr:AAA family ATPase [Azospirillum oleiclasticum]NYZ13848.1 AAA family ATPase [Azospirillum oleiclasticum]NYZ21120.1 AAA family ATPase [Azospirillum oleiclasticum]